MSSSSYQAADFAEFETSAGGTWRLGVVVDYVTKVCLAVAVLGRTAAADAIAMLRAAIEDGSPKARRRPSRRVTRTLPTFGCSFWSFIGRR